MRQYFQGRKVKAAQILQGDSISTWMANCYFPHGGAGGPAAGGRPVAEGAFRQGFGSRSAAGR